MDYTNLVVLIKYWPLSTC